MSQPKKELIRSVSASSGWHLSSVKVEDKMSTSNSINIQRVTMTCKAVETEKNDFSFMTGQAPFYVFKVESNNICNLLAFLLKTSKYGVIKP